MLWWNSSTVERWYSSKVVRLIQWYGTWNSGTVEEWCSGTVERWNSGTTHFQMSSEKIGKCRKVLKTIFQHFLKFLKFFRKSSGVFGSVWKCSENFENPRKIFECNLRFMNFL